MIHRRPAAGRARGGRPKPAARGRVAVDWPDHTTMKILAVMMIGGRLEFVADVLHLAHPDIQGGRLPLGNADVAPAIFAERGWIDFPSADAAVINPRGVTWCRIWLRQQGCSEKQLARLTLAQITRRL